MSLPPASILIPMIVILFVGVGFAIQSPLNASLGRHLGSGLAAGAVSTGISCLALLILTAAFGQLGALARIASAPPLLLVGGILGIGVVWGTLWAVPVLGIVTVMAGLVLGQMVGALILDATGAFALPVHAITPTRLLAVAMVGGGLILSRL